MDQGRFPQPGGQAHARACPYHDTHLHRIGTNYEQLPVNRPRSEVHTYNKDGAMRSAHSGDQPVYAPNSYGGPHADPSRYGDPSWFVEAGEIMRSAYKLHAEDDDFIQAGNLYREVMTPTDRDHLVKNLVAHLGDGVESGSSGNGQSHSGGVWTRASGRVSPRDSGWSFPTASADPAERCGAIRGARRGRTPWPRTRRALQLPV